jgi:hypothetical protein
MADHDDLLYRSQPHKLGWYTSSDLKALVADLRAALADLIMSKEESRYCWVCRDVHAGDDPTPPVRPHSDAVAGSATPDQENDDG